MNNQTYNYLQASDLSCFHNGQSFKAVMISQTHETNRKDINILLTSSSWYILVNYWMKLSMWRIKQIRESVIDRGRRPRWITPSEICRILHILRKPNSIIIIHSKYFPVLKGVLPFCSLFFHSPKSNTISSPGFLGQRFNNLQQTALFMSLVQYDKGSFQICSLAAGYGELCMWL